MKSILLASASVVVFAALSTGASAQVTVYGGGSTFAAKVDRDIFNCVTGNANSLLVGVTSPANETVPGTTNNDPVSYPTAQNAACTTDLGTLSTTVGVAYYAPTGSGAALTGYEAGLGSAYNLGKIGTNNPVPFELNGQDPLAQYGYPEMDFGASDAPVNNILTTTQPPYSLPSGYGVTVQVPVAGVGVGVVVKVTNPATHDLLDVNLSTANLCKIWSGEITNWSSTSLKNSFTDSVTRQTVALGPNESIYLTARDDGSGTTYLFTNFLANTCGKTYGFYVTQNVYPSTSNTVWSANNGLSETVLTKATIVATPTVSALHAINVWEDSGTSGSGGEANSVIATEGAIGYVGTDYVSNVPNPNISLVASLFPNATNVQVGLAAVKVPTAYTGRYTVTTKGKTTIDTKYGLNAWNTALAGKTTGHITTKGAYPIAGFTFLDVYSCPTATTGSVGAQALINYYVNAFNADAASPGSSNLSGVYSAANFVEPSGLVLAGVNKIVATIGGCTN